MSPEKAKAPTLVQTDGGTFDRGDWPIYFAAGSSDHYPLHTLIAVNDVMTASGERHLVSLLDGGHKILLDSGIFWLTNRHMRTHGGSMDEALRLPPEEIDGFPELFERYLYLATTYRDRLWGVIELDQGGAANKRRTRARLHDAGIRPMPVYHPLVDGWDYFDEIASTHDRMCFGNVVQARPPVRIRLLHTLWERRRQYPHLWVHVLGLTVNEWCLPFPPDSCDSSTWLNALRFPSVMTEMASLRRLGDLGPQFRYRLARRDDEGTEERVDGRISSRDKACRVYADSVTATNVTWHDLVDRTDHLGIDHYPTRLDMEGELTPWAPN